MLPILKHIFLQSMISRHRDRKTKTRRQHLTHTEPPKPQQKTRTTLETTQRNSSKSSNRVRKAGKRQKRERERGQWTHMASTSREKIMWNSSSAKLRRRKEEREAKLWRSAQLVAEFSPDKFFFQARPPPSLSSAVAPCLSVLESLHLGSMSASKGRKRKEGPARCGPLDLRGGRIAVHRWQRPRCKRRRGGAGEAGPDAAAGGEPGTVPPCPLSFLSFQLSFLG